MVETAGRAVNCLSTKLLVHFIFCEMSSFIRSNAVWTTVTVDEIFSKGTDGCFHRGFLGRKSKFIPRIIFCCRKKKILSFLRWM